MVQILEPKVSTNGGRERLSADICVDGNTHTLWFEVEKKYGRFLCHERSDAFVLAMLQYVLIHHEDITCEAPMTDRLYEQLTEQFLPPFCKINGLSTKIVASVAAEVDHPEDGVRVGSGISCGVDSLHVYACHDDIDLACIWSTGVVTLDNTAEIRADQVVALQKRAESFCNDKSLELLKGWTNFDGDFMPGVQWDGMTTNGNLFCIFAIQKLWRRYYVASDCDIANFHFKVGSINGDPARYEYFLFPFVCLDRIQVRMDGAAHNRVEKVGDLVKYEPAKRYLNVCWQTNENHRNGTNDCPKCMRTLLDLDAFGAVDDFKEVFDVEYFHKFQHEFLAEYYRGVIQKDNFALELVSYFKNRRFPIVMRIRAWKIVLKKAFKKVMRRGQTKQGGFSSKG